MVNSPEKAQAQGQTGSSPGLGCRLLNTPGLSTGPGVDLCPVKGYPLKKQGPSVPSFLLPTSRGTK